MGGSLAVRILIGFVAGICVGLAFKSLGWQPPIELSGLLGDLFLRALRMVVIPLIFSSLALSVAQLSDIARLSRLSCWTVVYYLVTNAIAVMIGLALVNVIQPGSGLPIGDGKPPQLPPLQLKTLVLNIIPANPIEALAKGEMLALIFLSLLTGAALLSAKDVGEPIQRLLNSVLQVTMVVVHWLLSVAPVGVFGLAVRLAAEFGLAVFLPLTKYAFTVILGLAIHGLFALPVLALLFARVHPFGYLRHFMPALLTAFSTSSSSATLPVTLECAERAGVHSEVRNFVLPLGTTINMDGTALYEAVAACFVAQVYGIHLSFTQQLLIFITANLAAIGAAGIPAGGLVTMPFVFQSVGLPLKGIALILPIDRFLDMFRTTINVLGDIIGCSVVQRAMNFEKQSSVEAPLGA
ncbi:MAG: dicarboxylate/amino acid:cation symporter [Armatimonadota bacterium]|nr:dicarboxylate/amino acid:cation symporter [Armatimonadota bacterium]MCX7777784.1 dicarboxylate/amino acid:cation symporter [Armatimonadota bacterium]MDW8025329.1 dicarboxylate/amino acid:cation symporter [Armatimonadota bacterium]